jgi:hypothetical protein
MPVSAPNVEAETNQTEDTHSRGKNSFRNGQKYQNHIVKSLQKCSLDGVRCEVAQVRGADAGPDATWKNTRNGDVGVEIKNEGAFEGGSVKMIYDADSTQEVNDDDQTVSEIADTTVDDRDCHEDRSINTAFKEAFKTFHSKMFVY